MTAIRGVHPYADMYPMLPESQIASMAESIRENGLREPIVVTVDGLILDGRNRRKACQLAGVEPVTEVYQGDDLAEYVMDRNDHRRHIPTGQSAMAAALVLQADGRRRNGRWVRGSVDTSNGSVTTSWKQRLNECGVILDHAPHLAEKVRDGDLALDAAFKMAKAHRDCGTISSSTRPRRSACPVEDVALPFDPDWEARVAELRRQQLWQADQKTHRTGEHLVNDHPPVFSVGYCDDGVILYRTGEDGQPFVHAIMDTTAAINYARDLCSVAEQLMKSAEDFVAHVNLVKDVDSSFTDDE